VPCDTIQRSQVEFLATSTDLHLLAEGLKALGFQVREGETGLNFAKYGTSGSFDKATGKLISSGFNELDTAAVKREYSTQVVTSQAKRHGWKIEWSTNAAGNREATVQKRG
jgi:hypothetical protein